MILVVCVALISLAIKIHGREVIDAEWPIVIDPESSYRHEECVTSPCNDLYPAKRSRAAEELEQMPPAIPYHVSSGPWQWMCPCETQYDILDLGSRNYPRYITRAHCRPNACLNRLHQCKLINYKVYILRERELNELSDTGDDQYMELVSLPEPFRIKWQLKPMTVAVACVAANQERKN